jgi:hypothetical protein
LLTKYALYCLFPLTHPCETSCEYRENHCLWTADKKCKFSSQGFQESALSATGLRIVSLSHITALLHILYSEDPGKGTGNPAGKSGPLVDFENVHAWTSPKMDISETIFRSPRTWTSPTSTRGHRRGPRVDISQSPQHGPQKKKKHIFQKKSVALAGFEPQSIAWKSIA